MSDEAIQQDEPQAEPQPVPQVTPQATPQPASSEASWRDSLPEDIRDNPNIQKYSSVESLAKAYVNASSMLGRDKLVMPKSDEEWGDFYDKIGRPQDYQGYEFEKVDLPEGTPVDEEMMETFKKVAHESGLTAKQANDLQKWYMSNMGDQFENMVRSAEDEMANAQTSLRKEWGNAYDQKMNQAMRAVREFGGDQLVAELDSSGFGNNPELIKAFAQAGEKIMGDVNLEGGNEGARTPANIKAEIFKIQNNPAFYDAENLERPGMVQKMQRLMEELHGKDIIGEYTIGRN
jgi:hypothetical protein